MEGRRLKFRKGLHPLYLPIYDALCAEMPPEWQPFYGVRTFDEQAAIYAQGRTKPGKIVSDAQPGESPHQYGCASDWIFWDGAQPVWLGASDPRWQVYFDACDKVDAKKGHDFGDNPHNELPIKVSWITVHQSYKVHGLMGALQTIWDAK